MIGCRGVSHYLCSILIPLLKKTTFYVPGWGTNVLKNGTSREIQDSWQRYIVIECQCLTYKVDLIFHCVLMVVVFCYFSAVNILNSGLSHVCTVHVRTLLHYRYRIWMHCTVMSSHTRDKDWTVRPQLFVLWQLRTVLWLYNSLLLLGVFSSLAISCHRNLYYRATLQC